MRKKLVPEERPICNVVTVYRERGNYLQRLEQFEKAILAYSEALRWNKTDVRSLLGRSLARAKATYYTGALADAARAAELEPQNVTALQIKAQTEYEKCSFERSLMLSYRGQRLRKLPPNFADCARCGEETIKFKDKVRHSVERITELASVEFIFVNAYRPPSSNFEMFEKILYEIRECVGSSASKMMSAALNVLKPMDLVGNSISITSKPYERKSRMQIQSTPQIQEISRVEKQKYQNVSRLMASKYLEQMAHDKYFLTALCKDERLASANKHRSRQLQELAKSALADVEKRQEVLRERRPLYAARAPETEARIRLMKVRKQRIGNSQRQHATDARRLIHCAQEMHDKHDTSKCLEAAEFGMEQIARIPANLLPEKENFLQELYEIVANAFLDQKRVRQEMSESDREKRAFILLGIPISREPSRDSILRNRPSAPPRDVKRRLRVLERCLTLSSRSAERCYVLHELARLHIDTKQAHRARFYAAKCQSEARSANEKIWLLNATLLLARCHILQNNRPESRATLIEGGGLARAFGLPDVGCFFDTCVDVSLEGEIGSNDSILEKREKAVVNLMQDDDMRQAAQHLFRRMSVIPASRRFSIMPGARVDDITPAGNRRASIMPRSQGPAQIGRTTRHPLGFQDFDV